ncbi:hypothetical protein FRB96_007089 [Tulasnella sp. 330]|nr:hypothetical protein FRB96_007089 [Tulasnella sp. 330]
MISDALKEARELDRNFAITKQIKGPLHGVPISFKDMYQVKGYDNSIGMTRYCNQHSVEDAGLVSQVRDAGGVLFVKTNVPQTPLAFECANPVFGRTTNPYNPDYTCGGSSGWEAALLACDGSALGFGSDIGGSLRIPAAFCGIYSFKPGYARFGSSTGIRRTTPGFEGIHVCRGPMGRSVDDIELACRLFFGKPSQLNEWLPPVPYRDATLAKKLKFGYYKAVQETVDALRRQGHECTEFMLPDMVEAGRLFIAMTSADKYETLLSHVGPDPKAREAHGFNGLICPVNALPTTRHGTTKDLAVLAFTTGIYNVVDHPVGIVPVTRVDEVKDVLSDIWRSSGIKGSLLLYGKIYERQKNPLYDATKLHGIPVGVQIVGKSWEDEKVIEMMKIVDAALGERAFGPGSWSQKHL